MISTYGLHEKVAKVAESIWEDYGEGWTVWSRSGDGTWCRLYDMDLGVSIELRLDDQRVMAKPYFVVPGFSGLVEGMELGMPNDHMHTVLCQLETIKFFLPKDNINDHWHEVVAAHMMKRREERRKQRELQRNKEAE